MHFPGKIPTKYRTLVLFLLLLPLGVRTAPVTPEENDRKPHKTHESHLETHGEPHASSYTRQMVYCGSWGGRDALMKVDTHRPDTVCDKGTKCDLNKRNEFTCVVDKVKNDEQAHVDSESPGSDIPLGKIMGC